MDPIQQAEEVLREAQSRVTTEGMQQLAQTVLLSAMQEKGLVEATLLFKSSQEGSKYMTGLLLTIGVQARSWTTLIAGEGDIDFSDYIDEKAEAQCPEVFSHQVARATLALKPDGTDEALALGRKIEGFAATHPAMDFGRMTVHLIHIYSELVNTMLAVRNGETLGDGDDS